MADKNNSTNNSTGFFCIDNDINTTGGYGFIERDIQAAKIDDGLIESGDTLIKMGSSIPTPFARLYLFDAAFSQIDSDENEHQKTGQIGVVDNDNSITPSSYHYLVSECLDMLELIYKYGGNNSFHAIPWNVSMECQNLAKDGQPGHKNLAEAINSAMGKGTAAPNTKNPLYFVQDIYIFTWGDSNIILGGISPLTGVYTSPNVRRDLEAKGLTNYFKGFGGNILFDAYNATPLHRRAERFRKFFHLYKQAFMKITESLSQDEPTLPPPYMNIRKYIEDSLSNYDGDLREWFNNTPTSNGRSFTYDPEQGIKDLVGNNAYLKDEDNKTVSVIGKRFIVSPNKVNPNSSNYTIKPTTDIYHHINVNGAQMTVDTPLVLTPSGLDGAIYVDGRMWNAGTDVIPVARDRNLLKRTLPGTEYNYPYLDIDDFLEPKIIEVSYIINKKYFYTGTDQNFTFLLPLKKNFFKFFTLDDLRKRGNDKPSLNIETKEDDNGDTVVVVDLSIPVNYGLPVTFHREYSKANGQVDCFADTHSFDLAIFPFYRRNDKKNEHAIMVGYSTDTDIRLYKIKDLTNNVSDQVDNRQLKVETTIRTQEMPLMTKHIDVPEDFDLMEVCVKDDGKEYTGLVVPLFTDVPQRTKHFSFSIDFGTTNTYVAIADTTDREAPVTENDVKPFTIDTNDDQVITLNTDNEFAEMTRFRTYLNREFVPDLISDETPESKSFEFPIRTATCETTDLNVKTRELFKSANVGFNYNNELTATNLKDCKYHTNIKWNLAADPMNKQRLKAFFKEILWMMKNKSLLNGGGDTFELIATYPLSMTDNEIYNFKTSWEDAKNELDLPLVQIDFETESITPYYAYLKNMRYNRPYMNFDIGGGSTDILFVNPKNGENATFSAAFAANDIWGDGIKKSVQRHENGFLKYYEGSSFNQDKSGFNSIKDNARFSADVINYLFSKDSSFSDAIRESGEMMQIPVVHFAALIFYAANILYLGEYTSPGYITFTGLGSKYIKMISSNEKTIAQIINKIFHYYGELVDSSVLKKANVTVEFAPQPKEVTAKGAIIMHGNEQRLSASDVDIVYGYDDEDDYWPKKIKCAQVEEMEGKVRDLFSKFVNIFSDDDFIDKLERTGVVISNNLPKKLMDLEEESYSIMVEKFKGDTRTLKEPLFFWPLKDGLYQLGKELAEEIITKKEKKN